MNTQTSLEFEYENLLDIKRTPEQQTRFEELIDLLYNISIQIDHALDDRDNNF